MLIANNECQSEPIYVDTESRGFTGSISNRGPQCSYQIKRFRGWPLKLFNNEFGNDNGWLAWQVKKNLASPVRNCSRLDRCCVTNYCGSTIIPVIFPGDLISVMARREFKLCADAFYDFNYPQMAGVIYCFI